jgi:glutaredoxin
VFITVRSTSALTTLAALVLATAMPVSVASAAERTGEKETPDVPHVVVLKDGERVPARTKPINAFGKVRFMDASGTNRVLPVSAIDVDKTREANAQTTGSNRGGTLSVGGGMADFEPSKPGEAAKPRSKSVRVYSATWCPYCRQLKQFLAEKGISASIIEVDKLPKAEQGRAMTEMRRLTGKVSYPTVVIGGRAVAGYSPSWILKSLEE